MTNSAASICKEKFIIEGVCHAAGQLFPFKCFINTAGLNFLTQALTLGIRCHSELTTIAPLRFIQGGGVRRNVIKKKNEKKMT